MKMRLHVWQYSALSLSGIKGGKSWGLGGGTLGWQGANAGMVVGWFRLYLISIKFECLDDVACVLSTILVDLVPKTGVQCTVH